MKLSKKHLYVTAPVVLVSLAACSAAPQDGRGDGTLSSSSSDEAVAAGAGTKAGTAACSLQVTASNQSQCDGEYGDACCFGKGDSASGFICREDGTCGPSQCTNLLSDNCDWDWVNDSDWTGTLADAKGDSLSIESTLTDTTVGGAGGIDMTDVGFTIGGQAFNASSSASDIAAAVQQTFTPAITDFLITAMSAVQVRQMPRGGVGRPAPGGRGGWAQWIPLVIEGVRLAWNAMDSWNFNGRTCAAVGRNAAQVVGSRSWAAPGNGPPNTTYNTCTRGTVQFVQVMGVWCDLGPIWQGQRLDQLTGAATASMLANACCDGAVAPRPACP